jgi:hypothetical protein
VSGHILTVTWEGYDGWATYKIQCSQPRESSCHASFDCDCETWEFLGTEESGLPTHRAYAEPGDQPGETHVGTYKDECSLSDWIVGDPEATLNGSITVPVREEWNAGYLTMHVGEE